MPHWKLLLAREEQWRPALMTKREWALLVETMDHGACYCKPCVRASKVGAPYGRRLAKALTRAARRVRRERVHGDTPELRAARREYRLLVEARGIKSRARLP